jgi:hypothetical protein
MARQGFDLSVTPTEVFVSQDGSLQNGSDRVSAGVTCIIVGLLALARLLLQVTRTLLDKHDPSSFQLMVKAASKASGATLFILILEGGAALFIGYIFLVGIRFFFPAGEELRCDKTTFTFSSIPSVSFRGRWKKRSFAVKDISELTYGVIVEGNPEKNIADIYGLDFYADDKQYKIFRGIEAADADEILMKLRAFGVDVIVNQDMKALIDKTRQANNGESWMDTSWMDHK